MIASHLSVTPTAEKLAAQLGGSFWSFALLTVSLSIPVAAWADIYKWTDANGGIVFSDVLPPQSEKVKNFEVVSKLARPGTSAQAVAPKEQALLSRIENLERELQARQYAPPPPDAAPPPEYGGYSPPASQPPPPATSYYDSGYYGGYYPSYYPSYGYSIVTPYSYAIPARSYISRPAFAVGRPAISVSRPAFAAPRIGSFSGGGGHFVGGRGGRR
jgi:hypothetical protein